jgi:hypothetical protein
MDTEQQERNLARLSMTLYRSRFQLGAQQGKRLLPKNLDDVHDYTYSLMIKMYKD